MISGDINIYKSGRVSAGLTQEHAAELIGVSVRSLIAYEVYERIPSDNIVHRMIEIYKTRHLAYQHIKRNSDLGRYLPDVSFEDLPRGVIALQNEMEDVMCKSRRIREIARDGCISEEESKDWKMIVKELNEMTGAALSLMFLNNLSEMV
jgi:DNA-binding XRE family transcriptional regulator